MTERSQQASATLCMPFEAWPERDRALWKCALAEADILEDIDAGRLANLAPASLNKYRKGWGRWLAHLARNDPQAISLQPSDRCSQARLQAYVDALGEAGNSTSTITNRLQELSVVTQALDPNFTPRLINRHIATIRPTAVSVQAKGHLTSSATLVDLGLSLIGSAQDPANIKHALAFRDGLVIAFLALHPVRLRNLAEFAIGRNLREQGHCYLLVWAGCETKNGIRYEVPLAPLLVEHMRAYLTIWRPILISRRGRWLGDIAGSVWVSADGSAMTKMGLAQRIKRHTQAAFGHALSPHRFRDAAATTLAIAAPDQVRAAAPLLGHRTFATTERYYIQVSSAQAQRSFLDAIKELRNA